MEQNKSKVTNKYDRVMSRVYNRSRTSLNSRSFVTRHQLSSPKVGAKPSSSNISSRVYSDLPAVLHDYKPVEPVGSPVKHPPTVKPRRTLKSLDPCLSDHRSPSKPERIRLNDIRAQSSAPAVCRRDPEGWSDAHMRQCYSSRSHTRLHELKEEINSFRKTEKLLNLRAKLYQRCGVVLDDAGEPCDGREPQPGSGADDNVASEISSGFMMMSEEWPFMYGAQVAGGDRPGRRRRTYADQTGSGPAQDYLEGQEYSE